MKIDVSLRGSLANAADEASTWERAGYSGVWTAEVAHDPFLPLALAAKSTSHVELGTSIAVAFARNPMLLAHLGWDLQVLSAGRFVLGLGSQIEPHITKRFSMEWSHPARRMREMVEAIRTIWDTWRFDQPLAFQGEFYRHTLMTPFFSPAADELAVVGPPPIFLAGVGPQMCEVAGEVCDGFFCHSFTTERYLREVTLPAIRRGRDRAGKSMEGFEVKGPGFVVTGEDEMAMAKAAAGTRSQIAFYASTPAYRPVLELHGLGDLQSELNALSKQGRWDEMGDRIDDEMLDTFAIVAPPETIADRIGDRFGDIATRMVLYTPYESRDGIWTEVIEHVKAL